MKIKEIETMTGYPRDEITYWNHDRDLLKKVGKIKIRNVNRNSADVLNTHGDNKKVLKEVNSFELSTLLGLCIVIKI